jgi:hypothetical protein
MTIDNLTPGAVFMGALFALALLSLGVAAWIVRIESSQR